MVVLKQSGVADGVRPLSARSVVVADDAVTLLLAERAALAAEVTALREAMDLSAAAARDAVARARRDGVVEGRRAGIASVELDETGRVEAVRKGVSDEAGRLGERLATLDGLAAALARACLGRVFARPDAMAAMVVDALAHRLAILRDQTVLTVRVSGVDFADDAALTAAVRGAGSDAVVTIDPVLPSGACRMAARLGQVDLDVPGQWNAIAAMLDGLAQA